MAAIRTSTGSDRPGRAARSSSAGRPRGSRGVRDLIFGAFPGCPSRAERGSPLIEGAERMNEDAQSALLKTLEEPPAGVTIALCADGEARLLPTVRSRCARVRLGARRSARHRGDRGRSRPRRPAHRVPARPARGRAPGPRPRVWAGARGGPDPGRADARPARPHGRSALRPAGGSACGRAPGDGPGGSPRARGRREPDRAWDAQAWGVDDAGARVGGGRLGDHRRGFRVAAGGRPRPTTRPR